MRHFLAAPSTRLAKASPYPGLVPVPTVVTRDGRTFTQIIWKRSDEVEGAAEPGAAAPSPSGRTHDAHLLVVDQGHALDHVPNLVEELRRLDVSRVPQRITDRHVLEGLLHEHVLDRLGGEGQLLMAATEEAGEDVPGLFPGDAEHHAGRVHTRRYGYRDGVVTIKRNHNALKIHVHRGSLARPDRMREIVKFKLRDKRHDGSPAANDSPLTDWYYHGPADHPHAHSVELSIYSRDPDRYHGDVTGDAEMEEFLREPFSLAGSPRFLPAWRRAFELAGADGGPFPGQAAPSLPGVAEHFTKGIEPFLRGLGYGRIDNLPSHWNVVHFLRKHGYRFVHPEQEKTVERLGTALAAVDAERRKTGLRPLTRAQQSWVVLLQNRAFQEAGVPPPELYLGGATYPLWLQDDGTPVNLWMWKPLG